MKKILLACLVAAASVVAEAKEATIADEPADSREGCLTDWTPFALTIAGPVGLPWGFWNVKGLQVGIWNDVYQLSGLQIGVVNVADRAYGLQIGVVNVIATDDVPFLPIVNWSF